MSKIVTIDTFDYKWLGNLKKQKRKQGNQGGRNKRNYLDIITAFDIETSKVVYKHERLKRKGKEEYVPRYQSYMYIWMWQFGLEYTVIGRTWEEFLLFKNNLIEAIPDDLMLMCYVHNLSYEFQFMRGIYDFDVDEVFALDKRKVLKCSMDNTIEYRCSYMHSNMSLNVYTHKMGAEHAKLDGKDFDYSIVRYPWTELTDEELQYCVNDVLGLVEASMIEMEHDGDNIYTFPFTSTGYVRRDAKRAMRQVNPMYVKNQLPDYDTYEMLREAFRGGNTHANRYYAGFILENVKGADESSAYPAQQCNELFPVSNFFMVGGCTFDDLMKLVNVRKKAVIMRASMTNVRLTNEHWGCPYLSKDKCRNIRGGVYDNGRVLEAEYLETTITDIDLRIILSEYDFDDFVPFQVAHARYGKLPPALVDVTIEYFEKKTELKGVEGEELFYMKSKNKLNSIYGMMAQDPVKQTVEFTDDDFIPREDDPEELLTISNSKAFLAYQWGVWVTAWARLRLEEGVREAGDGFVYCDTDSVYYTGDVDWSKLNKKRIQQSKESGAYATDPNGVTHYMGVFEEDEEVYEKFKTLGAKKYVAETNGKVKITIAGVNKKKGAKELAKHGGIESFKEGFTFVEAGGVDAFYNDKPEIDVIEVDGKTIPITSNVALVDGVYTLGITAEYERLLKISQNLLDIY